MTVCDVTTRTGFRCCVASGGGRARCARCFTLAGEGRWPAPLTTGAGGAAVGAPSIASLSHDGRSIASLSDCSAAQALSTDRATSKSRWAVVRARPALTRPRLDQQHHLGGEERDALPVAGERRQAGNVKHRGCPSYRPRWPRRRWRGSPLQAAGGPRRAVPDGRDRSGGRDRPWDRDWDQGQVQRLSAGRPRGPGTRLPTVGDELNIDSGEPAQQRRARRVRAS